MLRKLNRRRMWRCAVVIFAFGAFYAVESGLQPRTAKANSTVGPLGGSAALLPPPQQQGSQQQEQQPPPTPGPTAVLVSIALTPSNVQIPVSASQQFHATGFYSDNSTQDLTKSAVWSSTVPSVAPITGPGKVTAKKAGLTTISALSGEISGSANVNVVGPS